MQVDQRRSRALYEMLINGQVVNEYIFKDNGLTPNPLYEELISNFDRYYRDLYSNIGFELVLRDGFAYIRSIDPDDAQNDAVRKVQGLLLVLGRGVTELGYQFELLTDPDVGASSEILVQIAQGEDKQEVLAACDLKGSLVSNMEKVLSRRGIAFQNAKGNWVLSDAGKAFFSELFSDLNSKRP
ncbi:condensin complex protein MksE [Nitrincola sp. MINF-07-Sa-05]|uniref:condensin complex protein MksE n=1 Tax=Nitrincola salilacus TaxID=3400273 RepID=UPI0039185A0B